MVDSSIDFDRIKRLFHIRHERFDGPLHMKASHYHDAYEIYYLVKGERNYFIKDRTYHIQSGDLVLIDAGELHRTIDAGAPYTERILINFKKDLLSKFLEASDGLELLSCFRQSSVLRLSPIQQAEIVPILNKIVNESKKNDKEALTYMKLLITELLILLVRLSGKLEEQKMEHPSITHKKISDIVIYINTYYMEDITLELLSRLSFISPYHLSRTFKKVTGFNFIEYLNSVRAKEARRLLSSTGLSITQIAEKAGFESVTHFGRVFKSSTGLSPVKYRKEIKKNQI